MLHMPLMTLKMSSRCWHIVRGISSFNILKYFIRRIACSTKILLLAISFVFATSLAGIWLTPCLPGGVNKVAWRRVKSCNKLLKPLSAITQSKDESRVQCYVFITGPTTPAFWNKIDHTWGINTYQIFCGVVMLIITPALILMH